MAETPLWDKHDLLRRLDEDASLAAELLAIFIDDFQSKWPRLKQAFSDGDRALMSDLAHGLKGAAANIGATRLREVLTHFEEKALSAESRLIEDWIEQVEWIWPLFLKEIDGFLNPPSVSS